MLDPATKYPAMNYIFTLLLLFTFSNDHDLSLKLEIGNTYSQKSTSTMKMVQTVYGMEQEITTEVTGSIDFVVMEFVDNNYVLKTTYNSLTMKMKTPQGDFVMTSELMEENTDNIFSEIMRSMVGKEFYVKMGKNGSVEEILNLDNIFSSTFESFPDLTEMQKQELLSQLKQAYGEAAFKGNIEMITAIFPDEKVSLNDSWQNAISLESGFSGKINNTFSLTDVNANYIEITGSSTIETFDKEAFIQLNGMPSKYLMSGEMNSIIYVDPKTKWIQKAEINQNISGDMEILDNPEMPGGLKVPMIIEQNIKVAS